MNKTRTSVSIEEFSSTLTYIELVIMGTIMVIICIITIIGNALVMISFIMDKKLRTLSNYFLLSLAVSDVMIATFSMPLFTAYLLIGEWTLGPAICDMWLALDYTCSNASGLNLLIIGFDRYFSVTNPLKYKVKKTGKSVGIMITCVWLIALFLWPPWIYAWPYIEGGRTVPKDDCYIQFLVTNSYVTMITVMIDYYIPVSIMLVLYYRIWLVTKKRNRYLSDMDTAYKTESMCLQKKPSASDIDKKGFPFKAFLNSLGSHSKCSNGLTNLQVGTESHRDCVETLEKISTNNKTAEEMQINEYDTAFSKGSPSQTSSSFNTITEDNPISLSDDTEFKTTIPQKEGNIKHDNKAARVLTAILLAFLVTTTPYNVLVIVKNLDTTHSIIPDSLWSFVCYLFYINSTVNPLCYALANKNFRRTYWKILTCSWSLNSQYRICNYSSKSSSVGGAIMKNK